MLFDVCVCMCSQVRSSRRVLYLHHKLAIYIHAAPLWHLYGPTQGLRPRFTKHGVYVQPNDRQDSSVRSAGGEVKKCRGGVVVGAVETVETDRRVWGRQTLGAYVDILRMPTHSVITSRTLSTICTADMSDMCSQGL
jgi:hypothetical protein